MRTRQTVVAAVLLTLAALAVSLALYSSLPEQMPIHWNLRGEVDDWGDKRWAGFLMPGMMALFILLLLALPWLSPRNFAVDPFRQTFNYIMFLTIALLGYLHGVMLAAALHPELDVGRALVAGIFLFFALLGNVLGRVRRNFWIGVRTPWTLASEPVWIATHRLAARLFVLVGIVGALAVWLGAPLATLFWLLMVALFVPIVHSLMLYKRLERQGRV